MTSRPYFFKSVQLQAVLCLREGFTLKCPSWSSLTSLGQTLFERIGTVNYAECIKSFLFFFLRPLLHEIETSAAISLI